MRNCSSSDISAVSTVNKLNHKATVSDTKDQYYCGLLRSIKKQYYCANKWGRGLISFFFSL